MSDGYNGWTNYETWNVALWLDNEQGTYSYFTERAEELVKDAMDPDETDEDIRAEAAHRLADQLADFHTEHMPEVSGVYADLLGAALQAVDWREIAEHYVAEVEIDRPTEEDSDETE